MINSASVSKDMGGRDEPPRAIAHIGFLFSWLVDAGQLSFFSHSPDSLHLCAPSSKRDPATRRSRQAGQRRIVLA
jgi:hypothetical protein